MLNREGALAKPGRYRLSLQTTRAGKGRPAGDVLIADTLGRCLDAKIKPTLAGSALPPSDQEIAQRTGFASPFSALWWRYYNLFCHRNVFSEARSGLD
ncbi:hypothetical protein GCM10011335_09630 [Aureimonas glaciei]|uniref:Uncharacterized protein n=1 Tax=Aureimonas glaciei TaxID=1776957 RepID=A0A916XTG9_9HYPH|nr:hypothetical protein GCM10011335_09630 [Aureimonas glaciei]